MEIQGKPSPEYGEELQQKEKERIGKQKMDLGDEKLKELGMQLAKASEINDKPAPDSVYRKK